MKVFIICLSFFVGVAYWQLTSAAQISTRTIEYSLEMSRSSSIVMAREQAAVASGMVRYPCRVVNEVGTYVARCGKQSEQAKFTADLKKLHAFGFMQVEVVPINGPEVLLFEYPPITLNEESQQHLVKMAQQQLLFSHKTKSQEKQISSEDVSNFDDEQVAQGKYFVDRGWQAFKQNDFEFAINMFQLATQINETRLESTYGLALTSMQLKRWNQALIYLEDLYQQDYQQEGFSEQLVNVAFNAREFSKARLYVDLLEQEKRIEWKWRLKGQEMLESLARVSDKTSIGELHDFKRDYQVQLDDCNPYRGWLDFAKYNKKRGNASLHRDILLTLVNQCTGDEQKIEILYRMKKSFAERKVISEIEKLASSANSKLKLKLNQIHVETLLQLADKLNDDLIVQQAVIKEALLINAKNFNAKLMFAWNHFHQGNYSISNQLFAQLWEQHRNKKSLEGLLYSMAASGEIENAILLAEKHQMRSQLISLLKTKLGSLPADSNSIVNIAELILQYEPSYIPAHSGIAWFAVNKQQWEVAEHAFIRWQKIDENNRQPIEGYLLSLNKQKRYAEAYQVAKKYQNLYPNLELSTLKAEALEAFEQMNYLSTIKHLERVVTLEPTDFSMLKLLGWSYFKLNNWPSALEIFNQLFIIKEESDIAQGIVSCLEKLNRSNQLELFVEKLALNKDVAFRQIASNYYYYKQKTVYAAQILNAKDDVPTNYLNSHRAWIGVNYYRTDFNQTESLANYYENTVQLDFGFSTKPGNLLEISLMRESPQLQMSDSLLTTGQSFLEEDASLSEVKKKDWWGVFSFAHNLKSRWGFHLGKGPSLDSIDAQWIWGGYFQQYWGRVEIIKQPLFESLLAFYGYNDPYSQLSWGNVTQTQLSYQYQGQIDKTKSWALDAKHARYQGRSVIDNRSNQIYLSYENKLLWNESDVGYGLNAQYQSFDKNSNLYTFGHGGYFSPQSFFSTGAFLHLASSTIDWWRLKGGINYVDWSTDPVARFPFNSQTSPIDAAQKHDGFEMSFQAEKHWLINQHWDLGIAFQWQDSFQYQRAQMGINLQYLFGKRNSLIPKKSLFLEKQSIYDHL